MSEKLKPCPACGGEAKQSGDNVICCNGCCFLIGPDPDPDGSKWNAIPRLEDMTKFHKGVVSKIDINTGEIEIGPGKPDPEAGFLDRLALAAEVKALAAILGSTLFARALSGDLGEGLRRDANDIEDFVWAKALAIARGGKP